MAGAAQFAAPSKIDSRPPLASWNARMPHAPEAHLRFIIAVRRWWPFCTGRCFSRVVTAGCQCTRAKKIARTQKREALSLAKICTVQYRERYLSLISVPLCVCAAMTIIVCDVVKRCPTLWHIIIGLLRSEMVYRCIVSLGRPVDDLLFRSTIELRPFSLNSSIWYGCVCPFLVSFEYRPRIQSQSGRKARVLEVLFCTYNISPPRAIAYFIINKQNSWIVHESGSRFIEQHIDNNYNQKKSHRIKEKSNRQHARRNEAMAKIYNWKFMFFSIHI